MSNPLISLIQTQSPLCIMGAPTALCALLAEKAGAKALYMSGSGVAAIRGLPDLGVIEPQDIIHDAAAITARSNLPLVVDIDFGFDNPVVLERTVKQLAKLGVKAIQIEDQGVNKRCGHLEGKKLVTIAEMVNLIQTIRNALDDINSNCLIMARTDALAVEGEEGALSRAKAYEAAGADWLFYEAVTELSQYTTMRNTINAPIIANLTEYGQTPLWKQSELQKAGVSAVLYPLSGLRAMNQAYVATLSHIIDKGSQEGVLNLMQTRDQFYSLIDYYSEEKKIDAYHQLKPETEQRN